MVAKPFYIENTYYRYLPNPTTYSWNKKNFSLPKLILEFNRAVNDDDIAPQTDHLVQLQKWVHEVAKHLHSQKVWRDDSFFPLTLLRALNDAIAKCDKYLKDEGSDLVSLVIREHVQEVMRLLNAKAPSSSSSGADGSDESTLEQESHTFDELNSAGPEEKQQKFMDIYFTTVNQAVTRNCHEVLRKKKSTKYVHSPSQSRVDLANMVGVAADDATTVARQSVGSDQFEKGGADATTTEVNVRAPTPQLLVTPHHGDGLARLKRMSTTLHEQLTGNVWCTLVFRMLCWLLLHDFHRKDVQISKSELYGSRLPVYIV